MVNLATDGSQAYLEEDLETPIESTMELVRNNGSSSRSLGRKWEDMILPGHENPRNCADPDEMKMRWGLSTPECPKDVLPVA